MTVSLCHNLQNSLIPTHPECECKQTDGELLNRFLLFCWPTAGGGRGEPEEEEGEGEEEEEEEGDDADFN